MRDKEMKSEDMSRMTKIAIALAATTAMTMSATSAANAAPTAAKSVKVNVTYTGELTWQSTESVINVTTLTGKSGKVTDAFTSITGKGLAAVPSSGCTPFRGDGTLKGKKGTIVFTIASTAQACSAGEAAPALVEAKGTATVKSGTGTYKGATGSMTFKGTFMVQSVAAGAKETDKFTVTFTGTLKTK